MNMPNNNTKNKLDKILSEINKTTGSPAIAWTIENGKTTPNKGNFHYEFSTEKGYSVFRFGQREGEGFEVSEPIFKGAVSISTAITASQAFLNALLLSK